MCEGRSGSAKCASGGLAPRCELERLGVDDDAFESPRVVYESGPEL